MEPDFSGWVTRYGVKCTDGRTIRAPAFLENDGVQVPLVWQHNHSDPGNILGHLKLSHRDEGVRADGYFNDTEAGKSAKALVVHKDIVNLSIYANQLIQKGMDVLHGMIREGSLVIAGANPGAFIDFVNMVHGDGSTEVLEDEAVIYSNEKIEVVAHSAAPVKEESPTQTESLPKPVSPPAKPPLADLAHAISGAVSDNPNPPANPEDDSSVEDVIASLNPTQSRVVYALIGAALEQGGTAEQSDSEGQSASAITQDDNNQQEGAEVVHHNVFDQTADDKKRPGSNLSHAEAQEIFTSAQKLGSLKLAVEQYALSHGVDDISTLFPYDQPVTTTPDWIARRTEWVAGVLNGVRKSPFSRIRSWAADITMDDARARGYVTGALKKEEFYGVTRRVTTPTTFYKKQKLDRDDFLDITEFDVVAWMQSEMRVMLDEELARAILLGDGRDVSDPDKIPEDHIRPIVGDHELFVETLYVDLADANSSAAEIIDAVTDGMRYYRGTGQPVFYTTLAYITKMLLLKDTLGRRLYSTRAELADAMGVSALVPCEVMEAYSGYIGVIVNLVDYTVGSDRGGQVTMFDDFDIDYNKYTYLMEGRCSGALTKYKSALVVMEFSGAGGMLPDPTKPTFVRSTGVVTVPTVADVTYHTVDADGVESAALTPGAQAAISAGVTVHYRAKAAATHSFSSTAVCNWNFQRPHS